MEGLTYKTLKITVEPGDPCVIRWKGSIYLENPTRHINPYFEKLTEALLNKQVVVDFCHVDFMDSSAILSIVYLCKLFNSKGLDTLINFDKHIPWQASTFSALANLSRVLKHIRIEPCD